MNNHEDDKMVVAATMATVQFEAIAKMVKFEIARIAMKRVLEQNLDATTADTMRAIEESAFKMLLERARESSASGISVLDVSAGVMGSWVDEIVERAYAENEGVSL
jgi:ribosomal silencing factor RsfS